MKKFSQAKEQYRVALEEAPDLIPALVRFCEACIHMGDFDEARRTIAKLEQVGGSNAKVARAVEQLHERMGG